MKYLLAVALLALAVAACGKKEEPEVVPPGFCKTEAECQPVADRQNAYQDQLREKLMAQGVHEQYLPCGKYKTTKAPNGYWNVTRESAGCPATASQQDPHPEPSKAKQSKH
jgi:predicted small lipoprotein YifL